MKNLIRNICFLILISSGFSSCVYEKYPAGIGDEDRIDPNTTILHLDLKALNPSTMTTPAEKIKSVRVIILGTAPDVTTPDETEPDQGTEGGNVAQTMVECNRLYEFPIVNSSSFSYTLTWTSNLGKKSIYVIANEESVDVTLTEKLNGYTEMEDAGDLVDWLEGYSFAPRYDVTGNAIYLPYTYSKTDFTPLPGQVNSVNCWLVPVATKFVFYFQNKRDKPVNINGISMAYANTDSFLMPHVDDDALEMEYGGETLYWPDWLAAVSQSSWGYPEFGENEGFNQSYGWITDYTVPNPSDSRVFTFIAEGSADAFPVPAASEVTTDDGVETVPGSYTTKIFYLPESINYTNPAETDTPEATDGEDTGEEEQGQTYYLTIKLEDTGSGKAPTFENVPIPNLGALFRNTFVVIRMTMGQGEIELYAEIAPWNMKTANGWVSEGSAPGPNPFLIKKK